MNPNELLRIVDSLHREKNIDTDIVFQAIEAALASAARRQYGDEAEVDVHINREDATMVATLDGQPLDEEAIGRIGAQTAKQVIIQKIREAERDSLVEEFSGQIDDMVTGIVQRADGGATVVSLGSVEAILPRSQQIPGESHHVNERVRAVIYEVKPQGSRVKVVLSRTRPSLVRRLFEQEIPEVAEGVITVDALAREPGYRTKVAVSSTDQRVDCVGACVGVRGNRIKNIVDELAGERIDIVRYSDDPEVLITNSLQPAEVDQVLLCDMLGRAIVLVREDQLSLAIGRRGQNVRLGSKLCGWDIEIMTADELDDQIERAVAGFSVLDGVDDQLAQQLVEQGYLSYDDLSVIEPDAMMEMGGLTAEQVDAIVAQAEEKAEDAERAAAEERRRQKEQAKIDAAEAAAAAAEAAENEAEEADTDEAPVDEAPGEESSEEERVDAGGTTNDEPADGESSVVSADELGGESSSSEPDSAEVSPQPEDDSEEAAVAEPTEEEPKNSEGGVG
jgi:N utilization substance protein A